MIAVRSMCLHIFAPAAFALGSFGAAADDVPLEIRDGRFVVDGAGVPSGCLQRLTTDLNGDDLTRSVYLTRSSVRGCIDANDPGPDVDYAIVAELGDDTFDVRVCERVDGSMGADCSVLTVRFANYPYVLDGETKTVVALDKLGER